ncbi:MAG: hypothetical protein IJ026_07670 [Candidatus Methanomethylophilaceae archaeon]|nr:hypothetical protein [Candidatus Methanomethylophilaceae archaeon]
METDIRIYNDFTVSDVHGGRLYRLETPEGVADCTNFIFEEGFVVNRMDFRVREFTNQDRIGEMNYLMLNFPVHGRSVVEYGGNLFPRVPGTG